MMMLRVFFRILFFVHYVCYSRELSLYPLYEYEEDHELLQDAGLEAHHVHANHPAVVANHPELHEQLRVSMQGGPPFSENSLLFLQDDNVTDDDTDEEGVSEAPPLPASDEEALQGSLDSQQQVGASPNTSKQTPIQAQTQALQGPVNQILGGTPKQVIPGGPKQTMPGGPKQAIPGGPKQAIPKGPKQLPGGGPKQVAGGAPKQGPILKNPQQPGALGPSVLKGGPGGLRSGPQAASVQSKQGLPVLSNQGQPNAVQETQKQQPGNQGMSPKQAISKSNVAPAGGIQPIASQSETLMSPVVARQQQQVEQQDDSDDEIRQEFDFVVGGWPKCGTTTLLKSFGAHPETDMAPQEQCAIAAPALADAAVLGRLDTTLEAMDPTKVRAFKCPTAIYNYKSISRMEKHSPNAKFVIGIRHPVKMMQSFFNYRITEIYERGLAGTEPIPDFFELMTGSGEPWKGVSIASVRFELFLKQLGKTKVTPEDLAEMSSYTNYGYELAVKPSNFTFFLYTVDQLEDTDETRSAQLRLDLQSYLDLKAPIEPFGKENVNHQIGDSGHPETIDICDPLYANIRKTLVENGLKTTAWVKDHFLKSPDVIVANEEHFVETMQSWAVDPCEEVNDEAVEETDLSTDVVVETGMEDTTTIGNDVLQGDEDTS